MKEIMLKIDIALLATVVGILATALSSLNVLYNSNKRAIVDSQKILKALALLEQRLDHIEQRLDRTDNFIASNSGFAPGRGYGDK